MSETIWVTGMAGICPAGDNWKSIREKLQAGISCIQPKPEWAEIEGLRPRLAGVVENFERPAYYSRKKVRSMGRVALMATRVTEIALAAAQLDGEALLSSGRTGIAFGSTIGAEPAIRKFAERLGFQSTLTGITGATFIQLMSHTCAANLAQFFGIKGRVLPTNAGDTSGSQGIGYGLETLLTGRQDIMVSGGAEALSMVGASFFDMLHATSPASQSPIEVPRPFDRKRDGLIVAEGAASLILEREAHARERGVNPQGRVLSYASACDRPRQLHPGRECMTQVMKKALEQAHLTPDQIGWVHSHGLATKTADIEESWAIAEVFGNETPVINLKSYFGHTQAACGAIEAMLCIHLLNEGWLPAILHLEEADPDCAPLAYVTETIDCRAQYALHFCYSYSGVMTATILGSAKSNTPNESK